MRDDHSSLIEVLHWLEMGQARIKIYPDAASARRARTAIATYIISYGLEGYVVSMRENEVTISRPTPLPEPEPA